MSEDRNDHPSVIGLPPLIFAATLSVALALEFVVPLGWLPAGWSLWSTGGGIALILGGIGLASAGAVAFKRAGTNIEPHKPALVLVESGPYRFTRNPMYVGLITVMLGASLAGSLDWGLPLTVILWVILHHGVVVREEAYLIRKFGAPYEAFLDRTRRWL